MSITPKIQQNKNFTRLRGYLLIEASLKSFRSRWSPDQRAHKHYNNLKLAAGFRKQVGQVCENKLRVRRPATTTKNNFLTNENLGGEGCAKTSCGSGDPQQRPRITF